MQCETQAVVRGDSLILCQGTDSGPYLISHAVQGCFCIHKEGRELLVIMEFVVIHDFIHLLPMASASEQSRQVVASHSALEIPFHR